MEVLANTEYQDVYRVTAGVLLIVNKFTYLKWGNGNNKDYFISYDVKYKGYHKGCQKHLKELKENYESKYDKEQPMLPKGTVVYYGRPVIITDNKSDWDIQIKTTAECFSGNYYEIQKLLSSILYKIRTGYLN